MADTVIRVENLSKRYILNHQQEGQGKYKTLQDTMVDGAKSLVGAIQNPLASRRKALSKIQNSSREEFWAVKDVSFEIKQGDRVGIIGRNGAGKSTLLKLLSRIVEPTHGQIEITGRVASLLEVGTGFHPELTGRENIYLNGAILGMGREEIKRKFDEIVAFAEVEKFLDTPVKRYSSGMYVRLAFAVAAHLEPEILIVDEVLAVGDAQFQKKCLGKMEEIGKEGRTIIFVSHSMQSVRRLCSKSIYLEKGKNQLFHNIEEAISRYSGTADHGSFKIDLDALSRTSQFGRIARLLNLQLHPAFNLSYGEPLKLIFTIQCFEDISNLAIGIGFETTDGNRVLTLDSDHGHPALEVQTGIYQVFLNLDRNPLHPSQYSIKVAILDQAVMLDYLDNFAVWEVKSGVGDLVADRAYGGCRIPVNVSIKTLDTEFEAVC